MKVLTVLGTRPEIIRLSLIIEALDDAVDHVVVDTGQNPDPALSTAFYEELELRAPDHRLDLPAGRVGRRLGAVLGGVDELLAAEQPDRVVVLGDTDSAMAAIVAKRAGIPVVHLEAGNRCFDDRVPEEVNRRVIDHASDLLLPYTERSRDHLRDEGIPSSHIVVSGNPIHEVMQHHAARIESSDVLARLGLDHGGYGLATIHRQENVDDPRRLDALARSLDAAAAELGAPIVLSVHPRTADRLAAAGLDVSERIIASPPFGFADFVRLEAGARIVCTDSGTVQEECCLLGVPAVTLRDSTERPETVECGSNVVSGVEPDAVVAAVRLQLRRPRAWTPPGEYLRDDVSATVAGVVTGPLPA
ncbi:non-hydrolyzing UDP-N-acetylglucosamine 2-epimerase [Actinomarinicola tropica]|uniref:UDP-N-acetylglucosamine 2-epimerase (Non-hydrolyzing) n=1 Tax=Actinomarinicola tropica TaxID=2789776 RepID=A0A5Q2RHR7_9ACTN|nr:UDP-N-acetylglucosamine 2-epimerase (non-hydrolyzing) [Actinomarinicola tropica]QGG96329.1 UDP-N-acetylglucosamine 2-epimerase (non-hydrolyzing) [Actinomarinicola tropica]